MSLRYLFGLQRMLRCKNYTNNRRNDTSEKNTVKIN